MTFDFQPRLTGDLIDLRPAESADWAGLFAVGSDPAVWALHPHRDRWTEEKFRAYFEDGLSSGGALVARRRQGGSIIGWSRFSTEFADPDEVEIGWTFLARACWGGPHNAEMKRLMLWHAFGFVSRVLFRIGEGNLRSRRAVEKLGAALEEPPRAAAADPAHAGHVFYVLDRAAFAQQASAAP